MTWTRSRKVLLFAAMGALLLAVGFMQSWSLALAIVNLCIISAVMSLGVNMQWGYAGLFNAGVMGFAALGGLAAVLVSMPPISATWEAGGTGILATMAIAIVTVAASIFAYRRLRPDPVRAGLAIGAIVVVGYFAGRAFFLPATEAIELVEPAKTGYLGGLGLPILIAWPVGGLLAAAAAWVVGRVALGDRKSTRLNSSHSSVSRMPSSA